MASAPLARPNPKDICSDLAGLRIGLLTASASRLGGGVFEAVATQAEMIHARGGEAVVFALRDEHSDHDAARFAPGSLHLVDVVGPAMIGFAPQLTDRLVAADLDCLHLHGIWMYPSRAGATWAARTRRPYLISPHGMLDPWITGRGRAKKAIARIGYERASWRAARCFHALTPAEAQDIADQTGRRDTRVIANAGPPLAPPDPVPRGQRFVYIGRIHPKKNLAALIEAWRRCAADVTAAQASLTIAGWGEPEHVASLEASLAHAPPTIRFIGPCFGEDKRQLLAQARFVVLPSLSEGLPVAMLEAWAAGAPTIMTQACHLPEGVAAGAAITTGYTAEAIAAALGQALQRDEAGWQTMARAARALAAGPFAPETIFARWADAYRELTSPSPSEAVA